MNKVRARNKGKMARMYKAHNKSLRSIGGTYARGDVRLIWMCGEWMPVIKEEGFMKIYGMTSKELAGRFNNYNVVGGWDVSKA